MHTLKRILCDQYLFNFSVHIKTNTESFINSMKNENNVRGIFCKKCILLKNMNISFSRKFPEATSCNKSGLIYYRIQYLTVAYST